MQGGQHGLPSVWLRLELCDNQDSKEEVDDDNSDLSIDHDYDNQNHRHHLTNTGDQQSSAVFDEEERIEKVGGELCKSPRLLMITKLPDFYSALSNKVIVVIIIKIIDHPHHA